MAGPNLRNEEEEEEEYDSEEEEEMELMKLEDQLKTLAERIHDYRTTFPAQLNSTVSSILASQRPVLHQPEAFPTTDSLRPAESETMDVANVEDLEEAAKVKLLKQKIESNSSAIPLVLNRMKECIVMIDKLDSSNPVIHPAFKRKRTN